MKNSQILEIYEALYSIYSQKDLKITARIGYIISRDLKMLQEARGLIYSAREELLLKYGTQEENGNIRVPTDKIDEINKQIEQLLDVENNISLLKIPIKDIENLIIDISVIAKLVDIIEDEG